MIQTIQQRLSRIVDGRLFTNIIITLIVINAVTLGLETSDSLMAEHGVLLMRIDHFILGVFVLEISLRFLARGWRFFLSGWNWFDMFVVGVSFVPDGSALAALRTLRIFRILRLISVVPRLRQIVVSLLTAIPGLSYIIVLMLLVFYIGSVIATHLFSDSHPQWFGTLGASMYSLFQIMTLESWSMGIVRPVMEVHPWAWAFFVPFILVTSFTVLNLFIAVIVNALQHEEQVEAKKTRDTIREAAVHADEILQLEIQKLHRDIAELKALMLKQTK